MARKKEEITVLSVLQDLLVFQMARAGVPQSKIRGALRVDMNRVTRIAKLAKSDKNADS